MILKNRITLQKNAQIYTFPVFEDQRIGIEGNCAELLINLDVDEDCDSTSSIVKYGQNLCYEDLTSWIKKN